MDPVVAKYANQAVPRYTSYPTAPHFSINFGESMYRDFLVDLDPCKPVSLYIHIPYCRQMCWYCGCNMKLVSKYDPVKEYVDTLIEEISLVGEALPARMLVEHLHFGGGTPTALEPDDLERIMVALREAFLFTKTAELALESDPRTLTPQMIERIGRLGFNRASFGIQEFSPKVQEAINRVQPPEMVKKTVEGLRAAGVQQINFDLIYGLPHQTTQDLIQTVETCVSMKPNRFALFGYAHVPWVAKNQRMIKDEDLPDMDTRAEQASAAGERLEQLGYKAIGLDHFALPDDPLAQALEQGTLRRNFQGYTTDTCDALIGLGATSIGCTPSGHVQNFPDTGSWSRSVKVGRLPVNKGHALTKEDTLYGAVINALMCDGVADLDAIASAHRAEPRWSDAALDQLSPMIADGLVSFEGGKLAMTEKGRPLVRVAASAFDQYFQSAKARHSVAV